jgi:hypothetical protein
LWKSAPNTAFTTSWINGRLADQNQQAIESNFYILLRYLFMEVMMKKKALVIVGLVAVLLVSVAVVAAARGQSELAQVRAATAQFQRVEVAEAAGYVNVNVDECVAHPELGGMGYHFVNFDLVDLELDPVQPEILVYAPLPNGKLKLVAVEYAVPIAPWDAIHGADNPPMVLGQHLHANPHLGLYVLHAWIWQNNPAGMFEDWNPNVSC